MGCGTTETPRPAATRPMMEALCLLRFNAQGPDGLIDRKAPGQPSRLTDAHRAAPPAAVEIGPIPAIHGVVRWRLIDLCQWLWEEFRVSISKQTLSRELRAMGYRKLSARPRHHAQTEGAVERFKTRPAKPAGRPAAPRRPSRRRDRGGTGRAGFGRGGAGRAAGGAPASGLG